MPLFLCINQLKSVPVNTELPLKMYSSFCNEWINNYLTANKIGNEKFKRKNVVS